VEQLPDEYKPFVFFIAVTGLRLGGARSIKWQDIDLETGKLLVSRSIWRSRLKEPKTEASKRPLILPIELISVLRHLWRQSPFNQPEGFIFCRADGRPYDPDVIRESVLYPAMNRAGIERQERRHGFHIFWHTAGSIVHAATGNLKLIQELLGYSRISTTSDIYVHVPETMTGQATAIMVKEINLALSLPGEPELVN
jgi:integrase